jgi:hypothetical protein
MPAQQSASNHVALDPITHFIIAPVCLITFILTVVLAFHSRTTPELLLHLWLVVLAVTLLLLNFKTRVYSLKVQDRVIRLEERMRIAALLPPGEAAAATQALSTGQLIALRFASDGELPALLRATLEGNLQPKEIESRIVTWRPDYARI